MSVHSAKLIFNHCLCFAIPLYATLFLTAAPHHDLWVLIWVLPIWLLVIVDLISPSESRCQQDGLPVWLSDCFLLALAVVQVLNIVLLLNMAMQLQWGTAYAVLISLANLFAIKIAVGTSSAFSCIVLAHELIHRKQMYMKFVGRFLLTLVCYEHFFTEHIRGHHRRFGTPEDPATARFGESYESFWRRTIPAQFKSAWQLESDRLRNSLKGSVGIIRHRVLQGLVFECVLLLAIFYYFGVIAMIVFLMQALTAVRKLEAINYFEHWGLVRLPGNDKAQDAWDSDSWFTLHTMVGLSRHADHHLHASKPFYQLQLVDQSPKLPYGYFAMIFFTVFQNKRFRAMATQELQKSNIGQFARLDAGFKNEICDFQ